MRDATLKYLLLLPAMAIVVLTALYPLGYSLMTSFRDWRLTRSRVPTDWVGLENYQYAVTDPDFLESVWVTATFVVTSVVLTVVLAFLLALLLRRTGVFHSFTRIVLILPFAMSPALIGVSYRFMFNSEFGVLARFFGGIFPFLADRAWLADPDLAMLVLVATDVWHWTPYMTFVCLGGLASIPASTEEAARIDGASGPRIVWDVIIPQMRGVLMVVAILKTIFALKMFDQVVTLTGGGPGTSTQTLSFFVYQLGFHQFDIGYAAAVAYILTAIMIVVSLWYVGKLLNTDKPASA